MNYAGIDAHAKYLSVAVVNKSGDCVLEATVATSRPQELLDTLAPLRPLEAVVETCPFWPWIYDLLVPNGVGFQLAHAKRLRAIAANPQKNDRVDALLLARMLATGLIPRAWARDPGQRDLLRLLRHRVVLVRQRSAAANRIHAQLHQVRLLLAREELLKRKTRIWLKEMAWPRLSPEQRRLVRTQLRLIDVLSPMIRSLDRRIRGVGGDHEAVGLLRTVPGIGPFWGLMLAAELLPIERFPSPGHLVSYAGLAPRTSSSGGRTRHGSLPADANRWVRWAFISAMAGHAKKAPDTVLSQYYAVHKERLGWRTARVAAARKLARSCYHMLRTSEVWRDQ